MWHESCGDSLFTRTGVSTQPICSIRVLNLTLSLANCSQIAILSSWGSTIVAVTSGLANVTFGYTNVRLPCIFSLCNLLLAVVMKAFYLYIFERVKIKKTLYTQMSLWRDVCQLLLTWLGCLFINEIHIFFNWYVSC